LNVLNSVRFRAMDIEKRAEFKMSVAGKDILLLKMAR